MTDVSHATLTGSDLHEPKGVSSATSGQIYIANGAGSGSWSSASAALGFTGQIADFATPAVPAGWLECTGATISRTTYSALFAALTIQQQGTRTNGSAIITGLTTTGSFYAGYYVGGTGITNGTTIQSVDSATQITLTANATSSGSGTVIVSPYALGDGSTTFTIPDVATSGYYRRSRFSTNRIGLTQTDQNKTHTHTVSGTSGAGSAHTHTVNITDLGHTHTYDKPQATQNFTGGAVPAVPGFTAGTATSSNTTGVTAAAVNESAHTHSFSATTGNGSADGSEIRPVTIIVLTCIKT